MKTSHYFNLIIAILFSNLKAFAQTPTVQDCLGAIPIANSVYYEFNSYTGTGNIPNEINPAISCLGSGEKNDVWYRFTTIGSGIFGFNLIPNNLADDYDWAVYDITDTTCSAIAIEPGLQKSCNYSGQPGITGPNDSTGSQNNPLIQIIAHHTYVINVSQFSVSPNGYTISFINPQLLFMGNYFSGSVYVDNDSNCIKTAVDNASQRGIVSVNSGLFFILPDTAGYYSAFVDSGNYTLSFIPKKYYSSACPSSNLGYSFNFPAFGDSMPDNDFDLKINDTVNDMTIDLTKTGCNWNGNFYTNLFYKNNGTSTLSGTVNLIYDTALVYISSSVIPSSQSGDTLIWNYSNLPPDGYVIINSTFNNSFGNVNTKKISAYVTPLLQDTTPYDNSDSVSFTICFPYDPNEKSVEPQGIGSAGYIDTIQTLTYTVRFQNTGTAPVINALITDTLDTDLDPTNLQILSFSHPCNYAMVNRKVVFHFDGINLPDSNANEPASHGFVKYAIKQKPNLANGTIIKNYASIYFDFNSPITTNTVKNTIDYSLVGLAEHFENNSPFLIYPNPTTNKLTIETTMYTGVTEICIYNLLGEKCFASRTKTSKTTIDVSALKQGLYLLQLKADDKVWSKKFFKD